MLSIEDLAPYACIMEAFLTGGKGSLKGKSNKQKAKEGAVKRVLPWVEK